MDELIRMHLWSQPAGLFSLAELIGVFSLAFTNADALTLRRIAMSCIIALTTAAYLQIHQLSSSAGVCCMSATFAWAYVFNIHDLLCLSKFQYVKMANASQGANDELKRTRNEKPKSSLLWSLQMQWNLRRIGTSLEVRTPDQISSEVKQSPMTRSKFVIQRAILFLGCLGYMAFSSLQPRPPAETFGAIKQFLTGRWLEISREELIMRIVTSIFWYIGITAISQVAYTAFALVFVTTGISEPESWPAWSGSISEAYSIRQFWGSSWHQTWRRFLTANSDWITFELLGVRPGTIVARYTKIFFCFLVSGFIHMMADLAVGMPRQESGSMSYFVMQAFGIMLEDGIQHLNNQFGVIRSRLSKRVFGYAWLFVWIVWVTPQWSFPPARYMRPFKDDMIDFSFIRNISAQKTD